MCNLGPCGHVRVSTRAHKRVRIHHVPPRGCDFSRRDLYIRVSAYMFVHNSTGTYVHISSKALAQSLWNIRHVERSIILPSRKTCEDSCVSLSSFLLCTLLTISCNRSVCIFGNCSFTQSVLFHTHKHLYQVEHLTGALEVTD